MVQNWNELLPVKLVPTPRVFKDSKGFIHFTKVGGILLPKVRESEIGKVLMICWDVIPFSFLDFETRY